MLKVGVAGDTNGGGTNGAAKPRGSTGRGGAGPPRFPIRPRERVQAVVPAEYRGVPGGYWGVREGTGGLPAGNGSLPAHLSPPGRPGPAPLGLSSSLPPRALFPALGARQRPPHFPSPRPGSPRGDRERGRRGRGVPHPGTEREETAGTGTEDAEHRRYRPRWAPGIPAPGGHRG